MRASVRASVQSSTRSPMRPAVRPSARWSALARLLAVAAAVASCRSTGPAAPAPTSADAPTGPAAAASTTDPWQACAVDADCVVVTVDRGACDLCMDTWAVTAPRADDVRARYALTEAVDVCADRDHSCAAATAVCLAGTCALRAPATADGRAPRDLVHALPPR